MKKEENVDLIKGEFSPDEAKKILFTIINDKIKFNSRQILGMEERNSGDPERYKKRLAELKISLDSVLKLMEEAKLANSTIHIDAEIKIFIK